MATDFTEETATDAVIGSFAPSTDPRLREILASLVRHLHAFAREVELTIPEWNAGIDFLTRTGQKCDADRQEFILLSDVLGLSMLTETISNRKFGVATESTVLGPFHVVESPALESGAISTRSAPGRPAW
jgi:hydroxyquinol 1,2-dioxygenase